MGIKFKLLVIIPVLLGLCGCSIILQKRSPNDLEQIDTLSDQLKKEQLAKEELLRTKQELEEQFRKEIEEKNIRLQMLDRGLVITFIAEVLFDSGKSNIKDDGYSVLDKVSKVLGTHMLDRDIAIEGHTDNQPIKHSTWKSNWELSISRATSVLHHLVENKKINPRRLSAIGYGEYRPVESNDTAKGRLQNRRVEITILPEKVIKQKAAVTQSAPPAGEIK